MSAELIEKYGHKPNMIPVKYEYDEKLKVYRERHRPSADLFKGVGYDDR